MNVLWGSVQSGTPVCLHGQAEAVLTGLFGTAPSVLANSGEVSGLGVSDGGVVFGRATRDGVTLVLLGTLHHPIPDWKDGNPADSASAAAEYLLGRYNHAPDKFLAGVVGQYAIAVFDSVRRRVSLASDPIGHRTWYVYQQGGNAIFATNLRALAVSLGASLELDRSLEDFLLLYGFYPWGRTAYKHVTSLAKGTLRTWHDGQVSDRAISFSNPWEGKYTANLDAAPENEVIDVLYDAFMAALSEQLTSQPTVAVLLGGFDSALVAAGLQRLGKRVETFSFFYEEARYNQPHTDSLSTFLDTTHHWVPLTLEMLASGLREFTNQFNQPTNWPNYVIQTADACRVIRDRGITHCYSGDGCDSIFLGYPGTYRRARIFEAFPLVPPGPHGVLVNVLASDLLDRRLGHPYRVGMNLVRALSRPMPARGLLSFRIMDEVSIRQLRRDAPPIQEKTPDEIGRELAAPFSGLPSLRLAYLGKSMVSPNRNKMVGSSDGTGIAILSPYMHPGLKQLSTSLPERLCRPNERTPSKVTGKYVLMRMAEAKGLLPREVIYQPKVAAVDGPIDDWYAGPLRSTILDAMRGLPFSWNESYVDALLQPKLAERIFREHVMTDKVISHAVSLLATYAAFAQLAEHSHRNAASRLP